MRQCRLIFIPVLFVLLSCIPKTEVVKVPAADASEEALFTRAENLFSTQKYNSAVKAYNEYISKFPASSLVPAALIRLGSIYEISGDNSKALSSYFRIINNYPENIYFPEAKIKVLEIYSKQGMYEDLIKYSSEIFSDNLSDNNLFKAYVLVGDAQIALKRPSDAVISFFNARSKSTDDGSKLINTKFKNAVSQLKDNDIKSLIQNSQNDNLNGYLQNQLGLRYYDNGKYKEAASILNAFIRNTPDHEQVTEAKIILQKIYENSKNKPSAIGCLLPLTGTFNIFGNKALKGVKLALSKFSNDTDQTSRVSINLVIRDTESNPDNAAKAVKELAAEGVCAIIGPMGTDESVTAAKEAQAAKIPIILLTQKEDITDTGNYVFRNFLMPEMQVESIVKYSIKKRGIKRFAILYPEEIYGAKFMTLFYDEVIANGGSIASVESYNPSQTDFADIIKAMIGTQTSFNNSITKKPSDSLPEDEEQVDNKSNEHGELLLDFDAVFIPDSPAKAGLIIPQLVYNDINNVYLLGTNLWHSQKMITMAGEIMQDIAIIPDGFYGEKDSARMREFVNSFAEYFGEEPGFIEAVAYDTAMMLFQTADKPGTAFPESIRNELVKINNFNGLTGYTSFNGKQDAQKNLYLLTVQENRFVELDTD